MDSPPATTEELDRLERLIDDWLASEQTDNPVIDAVERHDGDERRWYVRVFGEEKDVWTLWLTLGQRTLRHETYVMPAPEDNAERFYRHLLVRNHKFNGMAFEIGDEDAVFLRGTLPVAAVTVPELDRILGSTWAYVEQCFRPAMRIGFKSRFKG